MKKNCDTCKHDDCGWKSECCETCLAGNPPTNWEPDDYYEPDTNAERIKNMNDKELAEFLMSKWFTDDVCKNCEGNYDRCGDFKYCESKIFEWLQQYANNI